MKFYQHKRRANVVVRIVDVLDNGSVVIDPVKYDDPDNWPSISDLEISNADFIDQYILIEE